MAHGRAPEAPKFKNQTTLGAGVKNQELLPKYVEKDTKQGPSSQFAERAGCGLKAVLQLRKAARAGYTCAGAAHKGTSPVLCCGGFLVPVSPA